MAVSLIEIVRHGGCYWIKQPNSPGHSLAIPNGIEFRVALEGPKSHKFLGGRCENSHYVIADGRTFSSANEAVNSIREPSSNAFLYIQFLVDGQWRPAETLRTDERFTCDPVHEEALRQAIDHLHGRLKRKNKTMASTDLTRKAAELVAQEPERRERAAKWLQELASLDLSELLTG
jgi:hypothetical protein